jgi:lipopolysaccharide transport system ATP-binding protein
MAFANRTDRQGTQSIKFVSFGLLSDDDKPIQNVMAGKPVKIAINYESSDATPRRDVQVAIAVHGKYDENLFHLSTDTLNHTFDVLPPKGTLVCCIPSMPLQPGQYSFNLFMTEGKEVADWIRNAGVIEMVSGDFFGSGRMPPVEQGPFLVQHRWQLVS